MATPEDFNKAAEDVKSLSKRPSNDQLLELYALFKQGSEGDVRAKRPGMLDLKGRAKWDAWKSKEGTSQESAKDGYVAYVKKLQSEIG